MKYLSGEVATFLLFAQINLASAQETTSLVLDLSQPISGAEVRLVSGFGFRYHPLSAEKRMHYGIDWSAAQGHAVLAAADGSVEVARRKGAYGNHIEVRHNGKLKTTYSHLVAIEPDIIKGMLVRRGQIIGRVGSTGLSSYSHLHFEVWVNGHPVNPLRK